MAFSDWIVSISASTIAIILGIAAYFAQKWIQSVDETLKEHSGDFKSITKQISSLESKQSSQAENISKAIHTQLAAVKLPFVKIDKIDEEVSLIKSVMQERLLPQAEKQAESLGRVLVLEDNVREQNQKLITMFNALKILISQKQKDQKPAQDSKPE